MSLAKQIKTTIILLVILIIVSIAWQAWNNRFDGHFNFECNEDSDCINTCCGCMTESEMMKNCPILCYFLPPRDCRCISSDCKDVLEKDTVWVSKQLTQCAEEWQPWVSERNKDRYKQDWEENKDYNIGLIKDGIKEFYQERDIMIHDIRYEELEPGMHCEACHCASDIMLHLLVSEADKDYLLERGFKSLD